jgi:predicted methyltransferase
MNKFTNVLIKFFLIANLTLALIAHAQSDSDYLQTIKSPLRTEQDLKIDQTRKPLDMLKFIQPRPGMAVLDIFSGGGYTAQLMNLAIGPSGKVWAFNTRPNQALTDRLQMHPQSNLIPVDGTLNELLTDSNGLIDIVTIVNSYHDMVNVNPEIQITNKRIYDLLKPGGILIIRDHEAKAGTGKSVTKTLHRIDPVSVTQDFESVGFRKIQEGDFVKNSADSKEEHSSKNETGTQGFVFKFIK